MNVVFDYLLQDRKHGDSVRNVIPKAAREYFTKLARKGGKARAQKLSPERRKEVARKAAQARWERAKTKTSTPKS